MRTCTRCGRSDVEFPYKRNQCRACINEQQRANYAKRRATPEGAQKIREDSRAWASTNRERSRAIKGAYVSRNPEKWVQYNHVRRARLHRANLEEFDRFEIYERDEGRCAHCGDYVPFENIHLDHLVPLSFPSWWAMALGHTRVNVAVSCAHCNWSKNNRTADFDKVLENVNNYGW